MDALWKWLKVERQDPQQDQSALRGMLDALDRVDPERARYLAGFAYLLGRVAHADQHVSPEETKTMEALVEQEGQIAREQAMLVVGLAKQSNLLFGGTDNVVVAREFGTRSTYEQKLALMRCLFALSAVENNISVAEETEIQRIARELKVEHADLVQLRLAYKQHLPGLSR
jgi:uncharacterized tellurite resistance protein B-like protein